MAYTDDYKAGKPVKINTIIEAVNSQLKNKIQSKIYYWRNNMPSGFPSEWIYLFSDKNTLPELKCDTSVNWNRFIQPGWHDRCEYADGASSYQDEFLAQEKSTYHGVLHLSGI